MKENNELQGKQTSRKYKRCPEREKSKTPSRDTLQVAVRVRKYAVRSFILTSWNQEENKNTLDEDYRPDVVLKPCTFQTDGDDSEYKSIVDSVISGNIN